MIRDYSAPEFDEKLFEQEREFRFIPINYVGFFSKKLEVIYGYIKEKKIRFRLDKTKEFQYFDSEKDKKTKYERLVRSRKKDLFTEDLATLVFEEYGDVLKKKYNIGIRGIIQIVNEIAKSIFIFLYNKPVVLSKLSTKTEMKQSELIKNSYSLHNRLGNLFCVKLEDKLNLHNENILNNSFGFYYEKTNKSPVMSNLWAVYPRMQAKLMHINVIGKAFGL